MFIAPLLVLVDELELEPLPVAVLVEVDTLVPVPSVLLVLVLTLEPLAASVEVTVVIVLAFEAGPPSSSNGSGELHPEAASNIAIGQILAIIGNSLSGPYPARPFPNTVKGVTSGIT